MIPPCAITSFVNWLSFLTFTKNLPSTTSSVLIVSGRLSEISRTLYLDTTALAAVVIAPPVAAFLRTKVLSSFILFIS